MAGPGAGGRLAALGLAWVAGVALHLHERSLWPMPVYAGLLAVGIAAVVGGLGLRRAFGAAVLGALLAGFGASGWHATLRMGEALSPALEGRDLALVGVVASMPQQGPSGLRFRFDVDRLVAPPGRRRRPGSPRPRLVHGAARGRGRAAAGARAARRAALALHRAPAAAARQPQSARLRLRARPARARRARDRLRARRAAAAMARRRRRRPARAAAPAPARRDPGRGRRPAQRRRAGRARGRRPGRDRARRLGPVPQHRHRAPGRRSAACT